MPFKYIIWYFGTHTHSHPHTIKTGNILICPKHVPVPPGNPSLLPVPASFHPQVATDLLSCHYIHLHFLECYTKLRSMCFFHLVSFTCNNLVMHSPCCVYWQATPFRCWVVSHCLGSHHSPFGWGDLSSEKWLAQGPLAGKWWTWTQVVASRASSLNCHLCVLSN